MSVRILQGDALTMLATLPAESVQVCVTSPPYFGLRSYATEPKIWGGSPAHTHEWGTVPSPGSRTSDTNPGPLQHNGNKGRERLTSDLCACGAWRGELGLEPTPALFIEHLVAIFDQVRRVLRADGTCWVNLGDSYWTRSAMRKGGNREQIKAMAGEIEMDSWAEHAAEGRTRYSSGHPTLKDKDLSLIPERFAIAMQDAGWWVRSAIAWCKLSAMPESVRDRPTSAWEYVFLLSKSAHYYYDAEAVKQTSVSTHGSGNGYKRPERLSVGGRGQDAPWQMQESANLRNYWLLGPEPSREAHYAAFPTEIPRRCILAGTSQKGACPACGAPWVRRVERVKGREVEAPKLSQLAATGVSSNGTGGSTLGIGGRGNGGAWEEHGSKSVTTGWSPSCTCHAGEPMPCVVMDPFLGSGTTLLVASRLGRSGVGVELSPTYARMAEKRIYGDCPMFSDVVVAS